jgi:hypothetical protein
MEAKMLKRKLLLFYCVLLICGISNRVYAVDSNTPVLDNNTLYIDIDNDSDSSTENIIFSHDNMSELMRIKENGCVGIGSGASLLSGPLTISDGVTGTGAIISLNTTTSGTDTGLYFHKSGTKYWELFMHNEGIPRISFKKSDGGSVLTLDQDGDVGIGAALPGTLLELNDSEPYITIKNDSHEDTDAGRESRIIFEGEQSGGEISTLAQIQASHDGTSDDEKGDIIFYTNDGSDGSSPTERMRIDSSGKVGIGSDAPDATLHIKATDAVINLERSGEIGWRFDSSQTDNTLRIWNDAVTTPVITMTESDYVGIGTTNPGAKLGVNGNIIATGGKIELNTGGAEIDAANTYDMDIRTNRDIYVDIDNDNNNNDRFFKITKNGGATRLFQVYENGDIYDVAGRIHASCDERYKKDIEDINRALSTVSQLRGVAFNWKNPRLEEEKHLHYGLIAQEVEEVIPEAVNTNDDGYKSIEWWQLNGLYVEAIKELKEQIEELRNKKVKKPEMPVGMIMSYAGTDAPEGWLLCDGSLKSAEKYPELANLLWNKEAKAYLYGGSNEEFNVPNIIKYEIQDSEGKINKTPAKLGKFGVVVNYIIKY